MPKANSFIEAVQQSLIKHPTQNGFSKQTWEKTFKTYSTTSEDDLRIFKAGLWFFDKFEAIRKKLEEFPEVGLGSDIELSRLYAAAVNREYAVIANAMDEDAASNKNKSVFVGSLLERRLPIGPHGLAIHPEGSIEALVSAIKYPLVVAKTAKQNDLPKISDIEVLRIIGVRLQLAASYDVLSIFWADCLWNGWAVTIQENSDILTPPSSHRYISEVIGEHRQDTLLFELTQRSIWFWKDMPNDLKEYELSRPRVTAIIRSGKNKEIKLGRISDNTIPPIDFIGGIAAEEIYWNDLLSQPLPKIKNLSIRNILSVWKVLASLGKVLESKLSKDTGVTTIKKLIEFAPKIQKEELTKTVMRATGLSFLDATAAMDVFIFTGDIKEDPWFKPIIPISSKEFTFIIPSLTVPNIIRSIERWMKDGGLNLDERGDLFESFVRKEISSSLKSSRYLSKSLIYPDALKINDDKQEEEIDLLWVFGSTIIVGEIKCSIYPASPIERFRYFEILQNAASQVKRKAAFVQSNLDKLLIKLGVTGINKDIIKIQPLVVSNLPLGTGIPIEDVPIVDLRILERYFEGEQKFLVETSINGEGEGAFKKYFFLSEEEAEKNLTPYLLNPPIHRIFLDLLKSETVPLMPKLTNEDKPCYYIRLFVSAPVADNKHQ